MIQIRRMQDRDVPVVAKIEHDIFSQPWSADSFHKCLSVQSDIYLVAEEDGILCGYCGLWGVIDEGQISNVAVVPKYRRRGIAEQLLRKIMEEAKQAKISEFTLEARVSNLPAITLYRKLGFREEGIRKNFYDFPKEDALIMWKRSENQAKEKGNIC